MIRGPMTSSSISACCTLVFALVVAIVASDAAAALLHPGDILIADPTALGGAGAVFRVDPLTGEQTLLASGGFLSDPYGVAYAPSGEVWVTDPSAALGPALIGIDPATGAQRIVAQGGLLVSPLGVAPAPDGSAIVADSQAFGGPGGVIRIDPLTGEQSAISSGGYFVDPYGVAVNGGGAIYVSGPTAFGHQIRGGLVAVYPGSAHQDLITFGGRLSAPVGVALGASGAYLADYDWYGGLGMVFRVVGSTQDTVTAAGLLLDPVGVAVEVTGAVLVVDANAFGGPGGVIRVDPASGDQSEVSSGGFMVDPYGIAVVPPLVATAGDRAAAGTGIALWSEISQSRYPAVAYEIPGSGDVRLDLYDIAGRRLASDVRVASGPGRHRHVFAGARLSPGVYLVRLEWAGRSAVTRLLRLQ